MLGLLRVRVRDSVRVRVRVSEIVLRLDDPRGCVEVVLPD